MTPVNVLFLGGDRYGHPLDPSLEKKFRALAGLGPIHVVGFSRDGRPRHFVQHARFYLLPGLPLPVLRYLLLACMGPVVALWCIIRNGVRIIVAQSPYEGAAGAWTKIVAAALGKQVSLIVENHGDFELSLFMQRQIRFPGLYRRVMRYTAHFALRHGDALRAISNSTRQQIQRWAPEKPVEQFSTWTDIELYLAAGLRRRPPQERVILYAGVLIPRKGIHFLLPAFAQIADAQPGVTLRLVGHPENREYEASLRQQVVQLGLEERVIFPGPLAPHQLAEEMAQAEVLVLPSVSEGLGRVVLEAMACGTPVIGSDVGGIPDMIADGENGFLVPPADVDALAERLRWVLAHPYRARQMGRRARALVRRSVSPELFARNYARLFQRVGE